MFCALHAHICMHIFTEVAYCINCVFWESITLPHHIQVDVYQISQLSYLIHSTFFPAIAIAYHYIFRKTKFTYIYIYPIMVDRNHMEPFYIIMFQPFRRLFTQRMWLMLWMRRWTTSPKTPLSNFSKQMSPWQRWHWWKTMNKRSTHEGSHGFDSQMHWTMTKNHCFTGSLVGIASFPETPTCLNHKNLSVCGSKRLGQTAIIGPTLLSFGPIQISMGPEGAKEGCGIFIKFQVKSRIEHWRPFRWQLRFHRPSWWWCNGRGDRVGDLCKITPGHAKADQARNFRPLLSIGRPAWLGPFLASLVGVCCMDSSTLHAYHFQNRVLFVMFFDHLFDIHPRYRNQCSAFGTVTHQETQSEKEERLKKMTRKARFAEWLHLAKLHFE